MEKYFCVLCSHLMCFKTKTDLEKHLRDLHFKDNKSSERHAIDLWIARHLTYQESLNKSMSQEIKTIPDRSKIIYRGCPVCDRIINVFGISNDPNTKGSDSHELMVRDINKDYSGNNVNHINPHLKYYPYECLICEDECIYSLDVSSKKDTETREVVKTAVKTLMRRHVIDKHLKDSTVEDFEKEIEKSIRSLKVTQLETITKRPSPEKVILKGIKQKSTPGPPREPRESKRVRTIVSTLIPTALPLLQPSIHLPQQPIRDKHFLVPIASIGPLNEPKKLTTPSISTAKVFLLKTVNELIPKIVKEIKSEIKLDDNYSMSSGDEVPDQSIHFQLKEKTPFYGCVFCYKRFLNYDKVFDHYLRHCNVFIGCAKCNLKFKTIEDFRSHDNRHNENSNLLYLNHLKTVRKTIEKLLNYLSKDRQSLIETTLDVSRVYCPVCLLLTNVYQIQSNRQLADNETIESHIHHHLNYMPYECVDCGYEDIKTEFCLDSNANRHLLERHKLENAYELNEKDLKSYFSNKNYKIKRLDEIIGQFVQIHHQINGFSTHFGLNFK